MKKEILLGCFLSLSVSITSAQTTTCEAATEVIARDLPLSLVLETDAMTNDSQVECGTEESNGPDQWFHMTGLDPELIYSVETSEEEGGQDTLIQIFYGSCNDLESIDCIDDTGDSLLAGISFNPDQDGSVWVLVESAPVDENDFFVVSFSQLIPEVEGGSCDIPLVYPEGMLPLDFEVAAGPESNETFVSCGSDVKAPDVWVVLPELEAGDYLIETLPAINSDVEDTRLELFEGTNCDDLLSVKCNDDINILENNYFSSIRFTSTGDPLMLLVETVGFDDLNSVTLRLSNAPAATFDQCDSAIDYSQQTIPFQEVQDFSGSGNFERIPCSTENEGLDRWILLPPTQDRTLYTLQLNSADATSAKQATGPSGANVAAVIYKGGCEDGMLVSCTPETQMPATISFAGETGTEFYVHLELYEEEGKPLSFDISMFEDGTPAFPGNSSCASAEIINPRFLPFDQTTDLRGENSQEAWFTFTPSETGFYHVASSSNQPVAIMTLEFKNECAAKSNTCGAPIFAPAPEFYPWLDADVEYVIGLTNPSPTTQYFSDFSLQVDGPLKEDSASNQDCSTPSIIALPFSEATTVSGSGFLELSSAIGGDSCMGELYYTFQASTDGIITVDLTDEFGSPGTIGLLSGDCTAPVIERIGLSPFEISAQNGQAFTIAIENYHFMPNQVLNVAISEVEAQANSFCDSATIIDSVPFQTTFDFSDTTDSGDFVPCNSGASLPELFWTFNPTESGKYRIAAGDLTQGSDVAVAVLQGADCSNAVAVDCNDVTLFGESMVVELLESETYYVVIESKISSILKTAENINFTLEKVSDNSTDGIDCATPALRQTDNFPLEEMLSLESNSSTNVYFNGPGHVYQIEINQTGMLHGEISSLTGSPDIAAILMLGACEPDDSNQKDIIGQSILELADREGTGGSEEINYYVIQGDQIYLYIEQKESLGDMLSVKLELMINNDFWIFY